MTRLKGFSKAHWFLKTTCVTLPTRPETCLSSWPENQPEHSRLLPKRILTETKRFGREENEA